jgi:hypothetical protein
MKTSPLSENENEIDTWLENQDNPLETYKPLPFDEIKAALQEWLTPEGEEEVEEVEEVEEQAPAKSNYSLSTKPEVKKSKSDKFDDLFGDEDDEDAPF